MDWTAIGPESCTNFNNSECILTHCTVLLFHFAPPGSSYGLDSHRSRILHKLQQFGVHPDTLHYSSFEEPNKVYCIFQVDFEFSRLRTGCRQPSSLLYVGSTAVGAAKRHLSRMAVYGRLKKTEFVDAELSLRYWASHDNLFQFALVPLQSYESYQLAWVTEHELIAQWQTPLNYPPSHGSHQENSLGLQNFLEEKGRVVWHLWPSVVAQTSQTDASSRQTADEELYAIKLSRNIENPHRNRVQGLLKSVPHQSIKKFLRNFQSWEETMWGPAFKLDAVPCPCAKSRNKLPDRCFSSGHVTAGLKEFEAMVPGCGSITSASAASMFFPGRAHWMTKSRALFDQWLKRHRLPTTLHPMFQKFCEEQWLQHVNMLEQTPRLNWAMLQKVKSTLHKDLVLYNEDHHPNHNMCFCPRFFLRGLCNAWGGPLLFRSLDGSPENWRQKMLDENSGTSLQTVFLELLYICLAATRHSFSETQKAVRQRTDYNFVCTVLVQQTFGDGIHCFDRDCQDTVLRQSRYAKHATTVGNPSTDTGQDPVKNTMSHGLLADVACGPFQGNADVQLLNLEKPWAFATRNTASMQRGDTLYVLSFGIIDLLMHEKDNRGMLNKFMSGITFSQCQAWPARYSGFNSHSALQPSRQSQVACHFNRGDAGVQETRLLAESCCFLYIGTSAGLMHFKK
eukprot:s5331_g2.t1